MNHFDRKEQETFDRKLRENLKRAAEGVNLSPQEERRIHDGIFLRCPEQRKRIAILLADVRRNTVYRFNPPILSLRILTGKNMSLF